MHEKIVLGSDHAGFELKEFVKKELEKRGIPYEDAGAQKLDPNDDYPVFAAKVARAVSGGDYTRGIAMCGSGIGVSITANRFKNIRATLVDTPDLARIARSHNNSNILVMGGRTVDEETARQILDAWLSTKFDGGRHERRLKQLEDTGA
ncbi:MAG: ribose 5-phosphate isomerase B [Chitinivibrionales bacterium]|nr:ribose 5-phosphate isomerase B [Chitinivibrionales bacterium]